MNTITIAVDSRYKVNKKSLKAALDQFLKDQRISSDCEFSVSIVGDRKMRAISRAYRGKDATTNVLSFSQNEKGPDQKEKFVGPPDHVLHLGDVIVSYPEVIKQASEGETMVFDALLDLTTHGTLHLLGIHHEQ